MTTRQRARKIGLLLMILVVLASACSATETVTINEQAVASATSTAVRENAAGNNSGSVDAGANPQEDSAQTTEADETASNPQPVGNAECRFDSIDDFDDIQIQLSFISPLTETEDASLTYEIYDGNGDLLTMTSTKLEELAPGEQVRMALDSLTDAPIDSTARTGITCEIVDIEPIPFGLDEFDPGPGDSCVFVEVDSFNDVQVEITVTSPLSNVAQLIIDYALRGPDGVRFDDGVAFPEDQVNPGESVTTPIDTFTEFPSWVNESSFSCEVLSIQEF